MKFKISLFLESAIALSIVLLLSGCFGDGGSSSAYDGTWNVSFVDSAFVPPTAASGATVSCTLKGYPVLPTITLVNGIGSTIQTDTCTGTAAFPAGNLDIFYLISVNITASTGAVSAIVGGGTLSGQCISSHGCAAHNGTASLSLQR
jgi:hypothetical protein